MCSVEKLDISSSHFYDAIATIHLAEFMVHAGFHPGRGGGGVRGVLTPHSECLGVISPPLIFKS